MRATGIHLERKFYNPNYHVMLLSWVNSLPQVPPGQLQRASNVPGHQQPPRGWNSCATMIRPEEDALVDYRATQKPKPGGIEAF
jgi:hypothetical protein